MTSTAVAMPSAVDPQRLAREAVGAGVGDQHEHREADGGADRGPVDAMPDATPCSRSATPVPAAMKIAVKRRRRRR